MVTYSTTTEEVISVSEAPNNGTGFGVSLASVRIFHLNSVSKRHMVNSSSSFPSLETFFFV